MIVAMPAQIGVERLVPPSPNQPPSQPQYSEYGVNGSASAAMSGTLRMVADPPFLTATDLPFRSWYFGMSQNLLTPPPVAPSPWLRSFQTVSELQASLLVTFSRVPPTEVISGCDP